MNETTLPVTNARLRARTGSRRLFQKAWADAEADWERQLTHHFGNLRETHIAKQSARTQSKNTQRRTTDYKVDDLVVLYDVHRPPGVEGKLRCPYMGPWVITAIHGNRTATLADESGHTLPRHVPLSHLKHWRTASVPQLKH